MLFIIISQLDLAIDRLILRKEGGTLPFALSFNTLFDVDIIHILLML